MKTAIVLFSFVVLVCTSHALPVQSVVDSVKDEIHGVPPLIARPDTEIVSEEYAQLVRERRSPGGWQPGRGGNNFPQPRPQPQPHQPRGSISGGVHRQKGVGTIAHVQGQGNVWTSRNGRGRIDAHGQWSKVIRGPARGKPSYNVGITYSHRF